MTRWIRSALVVLFGLAAFAVNAQVCTVTISPGADLTATVSARNTGDVVCLNPGTYFPPGSGFPNSNTFGIGVGVTVKGLGATPAQVILQGGAAADHAVYVVNFVNGKTANNAQLMNLTIQGSQGGVQVFNFANVPAPGVRMTDIKLKDVVVTTVAGGGGFGVLSHSSDRVVLDNVTITSHGTAINFLDTTDSLVMNSTVTNTVIENAIGVSILGGSGNRFVNNTIGQPRLSAGAGYSFNGGGVVFYNTSDNRFEGNTVQGMRDDAVDFTIVDNVSPVTKSLNNYVGKNNVIHTAFSLNGLAAGSAGIWSNCASDGTWIYGNETQGTAECGICVWAAKSNMVLGNKSYNNGVDGIFLSGGQEALDNCAAGGGAFRQKPVANYLLSNANYFNHNDQMNIRNADSTEIARGFTSSRSGLGGALQACNNPACQAFVSLETDASTFNTTIGSRLLLNTSVDTQRGLWNDSLGVSGPDYYGNRILNSPNSRFVTGGTINIDRGGTLGGNYWTNFIPAGNPSATPYTGVFDSASNTTGKVIDRFPFQSEHLGRGYNITVFEPRVNSNVARGTRRTVRWDSIGCVYVDLMLNGTVLPGGGPNIPNTGYAIVTIPAGAALGGASIAAICKDSAGAARSSAASPVFNVTTSSLSLVTPGRDDTFNGGQQIWVSWKNTSPSSTAAGNVLVEYSIDGGATWPTTLANVVQGGGTANAVQTSVRVTLPAQATAYGMIRVRTADGVAVDQTDGVFAVRGAAAGFTNVNAGRIIQMGQLERLEWVSPANSRLVTITATVNAVTRTVAADLPDRGFYDWIPPDFGSAGSMSITANFKTITGAAISSSTFATAGVTRYPTTITLGNPPTIGPGSAGNLPASTNSGAAVSLTSSTTGVCTVSGTTVTGVANGTCTITANATGTSVYATALPVTISFAIGGSQTITFTAPSYIGVGGTINLSATASSGLPVTFTSLTPGVCTISSGSVLAANTSGTCTVQATQPGNGSFAAAQPVNVNINSVPPANIPRLVNISTRGQVLTGADVMIGGFIIGGNTPKTVVIRANGPSLGALGVPGSLANPLLQLFSGQTQIGVNDNWQQAANAATIQSSGFAPLNPLESAIYTTLSPGPYTAIVSGSGGGTGVGQVEIFEVDLPNIPLINISTRGQVQTGNNVMIAGFIIQGTAPQTVVVRASGPSLTALGVPGALANPTLQLFSGQTVIASNDDWQQAANAATIQSSGFAPLNTLESAILITLNPGAYTAIVSGVNNGTGVGIVEVFAIQ